MLKKEMPIRSYTGIKWTTNPTNKKHLAIDFKNRCAYCDDLDSMYAGKDSYAVEHFAPKEKFPELRFTYENLLYSCPYCNRSKSDDWPSDSPTINIVGEIGYIDPCSKEYEDHLDRDKNTGIILHKTELGKYMYNHLKLYLKRHSILFMMDKLHQKIDELQDKINYDKSRHIDTSKKEEFLKIYKSEFYEYFCQIQKQ